MLSDWQGYVEDTRAILMDNNWTVQTTVCWGQRDRWLSFDGVEDFCKESKHRLVELPMVMTIFHGSFLVEDNVTNEGHSLEMNIKTLEYAF